jgi:hypothetical protein
VGEVDDGRDDRSLGASEEEVLHERAVDLDEVERMGRFATDTMVAALL